MTHRRRPTVQPLTLRERDELRLLRVRNGWSYREMAGSIGIPEATLHRILEGTVDRPHETTLYKVRAWLSSVVAGA